jgi:hypothetical protein
MPYVEGYKGQKIWVRKKCCEWCDYYEASTKVCTQTLEEVKKDYVCKYYAPRGQGGDG